MMSGNYISSAAIMDKTMSRLRITEMETEFAIEVLSDFMDHTKVPHVLENKVKFLKVTEGRAALPTDMSLLWQTSYVDGEDEIENAECGEGTLVPMRWATDTFHLRHHCGNSPDFEQDSAITYTLNKGYIYPNFESGIIAISYYAIPTDDDGYPMIPADEQWQKAAMFELAYWWALGAWNADEISDKKFQVIERERDWYFAQAVNYSKTSLLLDRMESMKNDNLRTIPVVNQHGNFYRNMQLPERRKFRPQSGGSNSISTVTSTTSKNITINTTS